MVESDILYERERVLQLQEIFPDIEENIIYEVLVQCGDNLENATEVLFSMTSTEIVEKAPAVAKESFMGLNDEDLEKIHRDLEEQEQENLKKKKKEDEELMKAINASMKQMKIDQKKQEKESKKKKKEEKKSGKKGVGEESKVKVEEDKPKRLSFGQKIKNLFSRKKRNTVEPPEDVEIPDIKRPKTYIND